MTKQESWARRVAEWRASGQSMGMFCKRREYSSSALYYWVRKAEEARAALPQEVRLVRVRRTRAARTDVSTSRTRGGAIIVELREARVVVDAGADRETLATVFELLGGAAR